MKLLIIMLLAVGLLSGCSTVVSDRVVNSVNAYCATASEFEQAAIRERIDARTDHRIRVECAR